MPGKENRSGLDQSPGVAGSQGGGVPAGSSGQGSASRALSGSGAATGGQSRIDLQTCLGNWDASTSLSRQRWDEICRRMVPENRALNR